MVGYIDSTGYIVVDLQWGKLVCGHNRHSLTIYGHNFNFDFP